jgi:hypothetical protein
MRQRRRIMRIVAHYHQTADVVRCRFYGELTTADDGGMALLADPVLESLHVNEAREAFLEVFRLDDEVLVHRNEILALDHKFGHWNFS